MLNFLKIRQRNLSIFLSVLFLIVDIRKTAYKTVRKLFMFLRTLILSFSITKLYVNRCIEFLCVSKMQKSECEMQKCNCKNAKKCLKLSLLLNVFKKNENLYLNFYNTDSLVNTSIECIIECVS